MTGSSAAWIRVVLKLYESQGVDQAWLLKTAGIDPAALELPDARVGLEPVNRLWRLAVAASGQPTLGLDRDLAARYIDFEVAVRSMGSGASLWAALESQSQYLALIDDAAGFTLEREHPNVWLTLSHGNDRSFPRQRIEHALLVTLLLCERVTRHPLRPLGVEFVFGEPADAHRHRMAFPCPLRFGRALNRMLLSCEDLGRPVAPASSSVRGVEERVLESLLASMQQVRISFRVSQEIVRGLRGGEIRADAIAAGIGQNEAAMLRQLRAERTSLAELFDLARRELAREYLARSGYSLAEIPALIGLTDEATFAAECRRWFGSTPSNYRLEHGPELPPTGSVPQAGGRYGAK